MVVICGAADVSVSVKAYFALKLAGHGVDEPHMVRARREILKLGGISTILNVDGIAQEIRRNRSVGPAGLLDAVEVLEELALSHESLP